MSDFFMLFQILQDSRPSFLTRELHKGEFSGQGRVAILSGPDYKDLSSDTDYQDLWSILFFLQPRATFSWLVDHSETRSVAVSSYHDFPMLLMNSIPSLMNFIHQLDGRFQKIVNPSTVS